MADKYLRSGAGGAATGADWPNAYTTWTNAAAGVSAGDTLYVAHDSSETLSTNLTISFPSAAGAAPVLVVVVDDSAASTNYTVANTPAASTLVTSHTTAQILATTGSNTLTLNGHLHTHGIFFDTLGNTFLNGSVDTVQTHRFFRWRCLSASARSLSTGSSGTSAGRTTLRDPVLQPGTGGSHVTIAANCEVFIEGGSLVEQVGTLTRYINTGSRNVFAFVRGTDFSGATVPSSSIAQILNGAGVIQMTGCKLPSGITLNGNVTSEEEGARFIIGSSGISGSAYEWTRYEETNIGEGTAVGSVYRSGGADDGNASNNVFSLKLQTKAGGTPGLARSHRMRLADFWWDTTNTKIRVHIAQKSGKTRPTNKQLWFEADFLNATAPARTIQSTLPQYTPLATGTTWTTDGSSSWTGLTTPVLSYLELTPTGDQSGPCTVWVYLGYDNSATDSEIYVCPKVEQIA